MVNLSTIAVDLVVGGVIVVDVVDVFGAGIDVVADAVNICWCSFNWERCCSSIF